MKGLFDKEQNQITSYGIAYENMNEAENVYVIPEDYSFDRYTYNGNEQCAYDINNFNLITSWQE